MQRRTAFSPPEDENSPAQLLIDIFSRRHRNLPYPSIQQKTEYHRQGIDSLKIFHRIWKKSQRRVLHVEKKFSFEIAGKRIKGSIDRIDDLGGGEVEIIDYKTGRDGGEILPKSNMQLDIYAIACQRQLKLQPKALSLYYIMTNRKVTVDADPLRLQGTEQAIADTIKQIDKKSFKPKPGYYCKWCDYKYLCPAYKYP